MKTASFALLTRLTTLFFVIASVGEASAHARDDSFPRTLRLADLPDSKMTGSVFDLYWQSSWPMDYRTWVAPAIYTPPTFAAYKTKRDSALEAILAYKDSE